MFENMTEDGRSGYQSSQIDTDYFLKCVILLNKRSHFHFYHNTLGDPFPMFGMILSQIFIL